MRKIDVKHLGRERVICCWEVDGWLIDPGPESCLDTLVATLGDEEPRGVLLTHIHFDHAGASGALVRRWPALEIHVHERGARHLADPEKLVSSARRLYGEEFDRLWGDVVPVPEHNLRVLHGGETLHGFRVEYAPGHASHHVIYLHEDSGRALTGDVAGVRIEPEAAVVAPTPPPDIDVDAWSRSLDTLAEWRPSALGLTHFGSVDRDVEHHIESMREQLVKEADWARTRDEAGFVTALEAEVRDAVGEESAACYHQAAPAWQLFLGLERYWRKRAEAEREQAGSSSR